MNHAHLLAEESYRETASVLIIMSSGAYEGKERINHILYSRKFSLVQISENFAK